MELIILIIIGSIISNVIKSMREAQQKSNQPNKKIPSQGDLSGKEFNLPGNQSPIVDAYSTEDPYTVSYSEQSNDQNSQDLSAERQIVASNFSPVASIQNPTYQDTESSYAIRTEQKQRRHKLDLSPDAFINGIILKEVLGPPKSRRHS